MAILEKGAPEQILPLYLEEAGAAGRSREELTALLPWDPGDLTALLASLIKQGQAINYDPEKERYILTATARELKQEISGNLSAYHRKNPMKPGLSKEELRTQLPPQLEVRLFNQLLNDLVQKQQIVLEKDLVRLASHRVTLARGPGGARQPPGRPLPPGPAVAAHPQGGRRRILRSPRTKSNSSSPCW